VKSFIAQLSSAKREKGTAGPDVALKTDWRLERSVEWCSKAAMSDVRDVSGSRICSAKGHDVKSQPYHYVCTDQHASKANGSNAFRAASHKFQYKTLKSI
jgi:hypothetical protein